MSGVEWPQGASRRDRLKRLWAESACRDLVLRAAALTDAGRYEELVALFTADASLTRPQGPTLQGREAIAQAYRGRPADRITVHLVCGTLFDAIDEGEARATSRVLLWSGDARSPVGPHGRAAESRQVVGHFADRFVLCPDGWRIAERVARFDLHSPAA